MKKLFFIVFITFFFKNILPQDYTLNKNLFLQNNLKFNNLALADSNLYLSEELQWLQRYGNWYVNSIKKYNYDSTGNNTRERQDFYNPIYNTASNIIIRNYNTNNKVSEEISLVGYNEEFNENWKKEYYYTNDDIYLDSMITYFWGNGWAQYWLDEYFYDNIGNNIGIDVSIWSGTEWTYSNRYTYIYDSNNNMIDKKTYGFNNDSFTFINGESYIYDDSNHLKTIQYYSDSGYVSSKIEISYTDSSKEEIIYYSGGNNSWIPYSRDFYSYNVYSKLIEKQMFTYSDNVWLLEQIIEYRYTPLGELTVIKNSSRGSISYILNQNYPNPFNPSTNIQYSIGSRQFVSLKVYDLLGREIATLVNEEKPAGSYEVEFSATGEGSSLTSGIYFYKLQAGDYTEVKKMIFMK